MTLIFFIKCLQIYISIQYITIVQIKTDQYIIKEMILKNKIYFNENSVFSESD